MAEDKRVGWLRNLKVGDSVFADRHDGGIMSPSIVRKISPTGRVSLDFANFNPDGTQIGSSRWHQLFLTEVTEKRALVQKNLRVKKELLVQLRGVSWTLSNYLQFTLSFSKLKRKRNHEQRKKKEPCRSA